MAIERRPQDPYSLEEWNSAPRNPPTGRVCAMTTVAPTEHSLVAVGARSGVGLSWSELTELNWGTSQPPEINWYLGRYSGCTRHTADGKNYVFVGGERLWVPAEGDQVAEDDAGAGGVTVEIGPATIIPNAVGIQNNQNPGAATVAPVRNVIHVWTRDPTWRRYVAEQASRSVAECHASNRDTIKEIASVDQLVAFLRDVPNLYPDNPIDYLDFHTHANSGLVAFQQDHLSNWNLDVLNGLDGSFAPGAHIEFHGCNVAEDFEGETFLYEVCRRLLTKGGKVGASTGAGFGISWVELGRGCVPHPFGDWVTWELRRDGNGFTLAGTNTDHPLAAAQQDAQQRLERARRDFAAACGLDRCDQETQRQITPYLDAAAPLIATNRGERFARLNVAKGRDYIKIAEDRIHQVQDWQRTIESLRHRPPGGW